MVFLTLRVYLVLGFSVSVSIVSFWRLVAVEHVCVPYSASEGHGGRLTRRRFQFCLCSVPCGILYPYWASREAQGRHVSIL